MSDPHARDAVTTPAAISAVCPNCGTTMGTVATVCTKCGATVSGDTQQDQSERIRVRLQDAIGDSYKLLELLGRGGMGIVFRAREVALDREVALKVLALDPLLNPDAYERFEREAKLAARLDHPHIVPIFAVGQRESIAYYTMRLVRGGSVEDMLQRDRQLEYDHIVSVLRDVAAALDYAHGRGVVHRDIKPANILIGETGHALVADFGIAKALGPTAGATGTGIIGSPGYMSPEQWRGDSLDGRADQYALGIVAYEMLTGRRPFETPSVQDLMKLHLTAQLRSVTNWRQGLPEQVDLALQRALAKHPPERFSTATAFVDALTGLRPVAVGARTLHGPKYEPRPSRSKRRPLLLLTGLLAAVTAVAFAVPQTRPHAIRYWELGTRRGEQLLVEYGLFWHSGPAIASAAPVSGDSTEPPAAALEGEGFSAESVLAGDRAPSAEHGEGVAPAPLVEPRSGPAEPPAERRPITMDTVLYGSQPAPFRSAATIEHGFVKVAVRGGAAPVIVDGRELSVTAGPSGQVIRLEPGTHYVSVRGAGVLFLPSQVTVTVSANDTVAAIFSVPIEPRPADAESTTARPPEEAAAAAPPK